ncbi:unnamed protein product, partial [Discosporangium mesarthrocarpum]
RCKQPFRERRGRWKKGPVLGPGVLPPDATDLAWPPNRDPHLEEILNKYCWDAHGRRHRR